MPVYIEQSGDLVGCHHSRTNNRTRKDRATQPLDHGRLRWVTGVMGVMGVTGVVRLTRGRYPPSDLECLSRQDSENIAQC